MRTQDTIYFRDLRNKPCINSISCPETNRILSRPIRTMQRFITNNTNWRVGRNCVKTANDCTYTVCSAGCSVNKKSQRWIPNCEMSSSINQTRGYPLNPAFAKLCSPLEHRALYALRTFFFYFMRNAGAVKFVLHSYHKPRLPEILDNASLRISRKRKPQQQY